MGHWHERVVKNEKDIQSIRIVLKKVDEARVEGLEVTKTNFEEHIKVIVGNAEYADKIKKRHQIYFIIGGILILLLIIYNIIQLFINLNLNNV